MAHSLKEEEAKADHREHISEKGASEGRAMCLGQCPGLGWQAPAKADADLFLAP